MLPIFPLNTVLLPGGVLPLRIFEPRYMQMVKDCLRNGQCFGVCLKWPELEWADSTGLTAPPVTVGCTAAITDWDMKDMGVLNIRALGMERFRMVATERQADGLLVAEVIMIPADKAVTIEPEQQNCVKLLASIITELEQQFFQTQHQGKIFPIHSPYQMEDAVWVSNRLCEILPIPLRAKQKLMELEGGAQRLEIVDIYLRQHKIV
jgi:Lon protease-like protein